MSSGVAARPVGAATGAGPWRRVAGLLGRHWPLLPLLAFGAVLRLLSMLAYQPALLFVDSYRYLYNLTRLDPDELDPIGYDLILKPLLALGGLQLVVVVQHLLGLAVGLAVYSLARRHGARNWLAALAAAPVLLDAYQVQIEQNIMSDLWLQALLVLILWLLVRRGPPGPVRSGLAGLALAVAVTIRTIALPLALPVLGYLLIAGGAWRDPVRRRLALRVGALVACFGLVLFCYAGYFHRETGHWGLAGSSDSVLYGRTAEIADCSELDLDPTLSELCPAEPLGARRGVDWYAHLDGDPGWPGDVPVGRTVSQLQNEFALRVIERQPLAVAGAIITDFAKGFGLGRTSSPDDVPVQRWQFQPFYPQWESRAVMLYYSRQYGGTDPSVRLGPATFLRDYQLGGGYTPGPALAACAVLGLAGAVWRRRSGIRSATLLITSAGLVILFASAMFEFSWRYQLPGLVLLPLGGVLGLTGLLGPLRRPAPARRQRLLRPFPDPQDWAGLRDFTARHGSHRFPPVLVLIAVPTGAAAPDELGAVLDGLPAECCGLDVRVLVVTGDGSGDTARVAAEHGALVCVSPASEESGAPGAAGDPAESGVGRERGALLRLGYRLAGYGGARYVLTTEPDGRYAGVDPELLLAPLVGDEADLVTGSRRLGGGPAGPGVRLPAVLAGLLSGQRVTDAGCGFRALRTDLAVAVSLRQPRHQAPELLLSALVAGARVLERPVTAPGGDPGPDQARALLRTWLREYPLLRRRVPAAWPSADPARRT